MISDHLELVSADGRVMRIGVRTEVGKALARQFGPDGEFWDTRQCVLERRPSRQWIVLPVEGSTNDTLINGKTLSAPYALAHGDSIAVGREAKGIIKLPLTARGR